MKELVITIPDPTLPFLWAISFYPRLSFLFSFCFSYVLSLDLHYLMKHHNDNLEDAVLCVLALVMLHVPVRWM